MTLFQSISTENESVTFVPAQCQGFQRFAAKAVKVVFEFSYVNHQAQHPSQAVEGKRTGGSLRAGQVPLLSTYPPQALHGIELYLPP